MVLKFELRCGKHTSIIIPNGIDKPLVDTCTNSSILTVFTKPYINGDFSIVIGTNIVITSGSKKLVFGCTTENEDSIVTLIRLYKFANAQLCIRNYCVVDADNDELVTPIGITKGISIGTNTHIFFIVKNVVRCSDASSDKEIENAADKLIGVKADQVSFVTVVADVNIHATRTTVMIGIRNTMLHLEKTTDVIMQYLTRVCIEAITK